ncbi:MAG: YIP1 family protein [Bacilli bacterium]|nr:YIP1 family protein [Bacilli bacterium]
MANFCTKCGKKLNGKKCDCEEIKKEEENIDTEETVPLNDLNLYIEITKDMFVKPITTLKETIKAENVRAGFLSIVINCFLLAGFACLVTEERLGNSILGFEIFSGSLSYAKIFIQSFTTLFLLYLVLTSLLYIISDVCLKKKTSYAKIITLLGTISAVNIVTNILAILFIYLSVQLMTIILVAGGLLFLFYLYKGVSLIIPIEENKVAYLLTFVLTILFILAAYVIPGILN